MTGEPVTDLRLRLAWDWFHYHASQRLTAFHFFLISVGLIAVAYGQAVNADSKVFGATAASVGAVLALGFVQLDRRNTLLVEQGRRALRALQKELNLELVEERKAVGWRELLSHHRVVLRGMELLVCVAFVAAAVWAATGYGG